MQTRIYKVQGLDTTEMGGACHLVEATSAAQAVRHVVRGKLTAKVATTKEVATLMGQKIPIENAAQTETASN